MTISENPTAETGVDTEEAEFATGCRIMPLPDRLQRKAADVAAKVNPVNAPILELMSLPDGIDAPMRLTVDTAKYWGPQPMTLPVSFMETIPSDLQTRIVDHLNAWGSSCGINFALTSGTGDVRISRELEGYWSYLGTDIKLIPEHLPTMNLQGFTMNTPEREYRRVVRHEAGHTLGFPHEHMRKALVDRIDPEKAYIYFARTQGWSRQTVDEQVLTPLDEFSVFGTPADQDSIMCYQLPAEITIDGRPISGGLDINQSDFSFAGLIYPRFSLSAGFLAKDEGVRVASRVQDWDPADDVYVD